MLTMYCAVFTEARFIHSMEVGSQALPLYRGIVQCVVSSAWLSAMYVGERMLCLWGVCVYINYAFVFLFSSVQIYVVFPFYASHCLCSCVMCPLSSSFMWRRKCPGCLLIVLVADVGSATITHILKQWVKTSLAMTMHSPFWPRYHSLYNPT